MKHTALFFYDIISPYSYLFLKMRHVIDARIDLVPTPIFLPGLLKRQQNVGPAEVPEKRLYTYEFCIWKASQLSIPFCIPARHPFPSVGAQRLLLKHKANFDMLDRAFDFVWAQGRDPELEWTEFCLAMGLPKDEPKPNEDVIKHSLIQNTHHAGDLGVFGVPSIVLNDKVFWGLDSMQWILDVLDNPALRESPEHQRVGSIINPLAKPI
jgi:2-hydroxychromene-2-carboxylate isomerase